MGALDRGGAVGHARGGPLTKSPPRKDRASYSTNTSPASEAGRSDSAAAVYAMAMRARRPPADPVCYLIVRPAMQRRPAWAKVRGAIGRQLAGVRLTDYRDVFGSPADYAERWLEVLAALAGLVVVPDFSGHAGRGAAREIPQAMAARLPVLVLGPRGLVALAECRLTIVPEDQRLPQRELQIEPGRAGEATAASLAAMGVQARSSRRPSCS
jgi:hypothetical protein